MAVHQALRQRGVARRLPRRPRCCRRRCDGARRCAAVRVPLPALRYALHVLPRPATAAIDYDVAVWTSRAAFLTLPQQFSISNIDCTPPVILFEAQTALHNCATQFQRISERLLLKPSEAPGVSELRISGQPGAPGSSRSRAGLPRRWLPRSRVRLVAQSRACDWSCLTAQAQVQPAGGMAPRPAQRSSGQAGTHWSANRIGPSDLRNLLG